MTAKKTAPPIEDTKPMEPPAGPKTAGARTSPEPTGGSPPLSTPGASRLPKPKVAALRPQPVVGHARPETQVPFADDTPTGGGHTNGETQGWAAAPGLLNLRIFAEVFEDVQKQRIATTNRAERGGIDPAFLEPTLARLEDAEKEAAKVMRACYRDTVPAGVRQWQADTLGIGEHLVARLLGTIGHPVETIVYEWGGEGSDRELVEVGPMVRTVSQLWSYCGHGDAARKRAKGMSAAQAAGLGNPRAKMLVHLLAESCMKQRRSPYRAMYDEARMAYEAREWTDLHRHNAALRKTGKAILKDLWIEAGGAAMGQAQPIPRSPRPTTVAGQRTTDAQLRPAGDLIAPPPIHESKPIHLAAVAR